MKINELKDEDTKHNSIQNIIFNLANLQILSEDLDISNTPIFSESGYPTTIENLVKDNKPKLIFRFSKTNCDQCIDSVLVVLNKYRHNIGHDNIYLFSDYDDENDISID